MRWPLRAFTTVKRLPLVQPAPLVISLEELSPVWLRHNHDFRPAQGEAGRTMTSPTPSMAEALAPAPVRPAPVVALSGGEAPAPTKPGPVAAPAVIPELKPSSSALVRDFVVPYQGILQTQGVLKPILRLIDLLDGYGQCPSVVLEEKTQDEEAGDLYSIRDTLAQVTLKDHTHRVTKHGLAELQARYKDPEPLVPKMLVACLGHDLGKIPAFRASGIYSMRDHPAVSVVKVKELFDGTPVFWLDEVCQVILAHHRHVKDGFASLLKDADGHAREEEVAMVTKTLEIKAWKDWFDPREFLTSIEPLINVVAPASQKKGEWTAFSSGGVIYCQTKPLYSLIRDYARSKKIVDIHLLRQSDRDSVLRKLADTLQEAGVLAEPIGEGFFGRPYTLKLKNQKQVRSYCLPIAESAFSTKPSVLEQRKTGFFSLIQDVGR